MQPDYINDFLINYNTQRKEYVITFSYVEGNGDGADGFFNDVAKVVMTEAILANLRDVITKVLQ